MRNGTLVLFGVLLAACCVVYALETVDVNREDVQLAANEAAKALMKELRGKFQHRLHKVLKARVHKVKDMTVYKMDVIVGMTECLRTEEYDNDCEFQNNLSTYKKCDVLVRKNSNGNHKLVTSGCILASGKDI